MSHKFVLRTSDTAWIERHNGAVDSDGRVTVEVEKAERTIIAGREWIRTLFTEVPDDAPNGNISCPLEWVEGKPIVPRDQLPPLSERQRHLRDAERSANMEALRKALGM